MGAGRKCCRCGDFCDLRSCNEEHLAFRSFCEQDPCVMILIAVLRGILHYMEQYCNHFIAFKLLAIIRHKYLPLCESSVLQSWKAVTRVI